MKYRKHIRLRGYNYEAGYYFITICTKNRKMFLSPRISKKYRHQFVVAAGPWPAEAEKLTDLVEHNLLDIENKFNAILDFYCIMPNHIHFILRIKEARQGRAATKLSWIVNAFKGWGTRKIGKSIFQPNYYEHIIRSEKNLEKIRNYILKNPYVEYENIMWNRIDPEPA